MKKTTVNEVQNIKSKEKWNQDKFFVLLKKKNMLSFLSFVASLAFVFGKDEPLMGMLNLPCHLQTSNC